MSIFLSCGDRDKVLDEAVVYTECTQQPVVYTLSRVRKASIHTHMYTGYNLDN